MTTCYAIRDWAERFEVNSSQRRWTPGDKRMGRPPEYLRLPVHGRAKSAEYQRIEHAAATPAKLEAAWAVWTKLLEIAADAYGDQRGWILNERGQPATMEDLAFFTGFRRQTVARGLEVLMHPLVGLVQEARPPWAPDEPDEAADTVNDLDGSRFSADPAEIRENAANNSAREGKREAAQKRKEKPPAAPAEGKRGANAEPRREPRATARNSEAEAGEAKPAKPAKPANNSTHRNGGPAGRAAPAENRAPPGQGLKLPADGRIAPEVMAAALFRLLRLGRGERQQFASDMGTFRRMAAHVNAGYVGQGDHEKRHVVQALYIHAEQLGRSRRKHKAKALVGWWKDRLAEHGHSWSDVPEPDRASEPQTTGQGAAQQ